jgi:hypothetical protein
MPKAALRLGGTGWTAWLAPREGFQAVDVEAVARRRRKWSRGRVYRAGAALGSTSDWCPDLASDRAGPECDGVATG